MKTWKEFKEALEAEGVTDDMKMQYIDVGAYDVEIVEFNEDKTEFRVWG
jgi:uncharacterized protein with GYD domain